jgi:hypothetical protein
MSKQITLRIKRVWLEDLVFGTKRIEYRDTTLFYGRQFCRDVAECEEGSEGVIRDDITLMKVFCPLGSSGKKLEALFPVKMIDLSDDGKQFRIHVGDCIEHNLPKPKAKS